MAAPGRLLHSPADRESTVQLNDGLVEDDRHDAAASLATPLWHVRKPRHLKAALACAHRAAPQLDALARLLLPRVPTRVLCSSTIKRDDGGPQSACMLPLEEAITHQWISFNNKDWTNTETADCDTPEWYDRLDELRLYGLPPPLFIAVSSWKGTAHLVWLYDRSIRSGDPDARRLRQRIKQGLIVAFGADGKFSNRLQKNPFHRREGPLAPRIGCPGIPAIADADEASGCRLTYCTILPAEPRAVAPRALLQPLIAYAEERGIFLSDDCAAHVSAKKTGIVFRARRRLPGRPEDFPRGSRLFHMSRLRVYRTPTTDEATIRAIVDQTAIDLGSPATPPQRRSIAASIAEFMRDRWDWSRTPGSGRTPNIDRGVMAMEAGANGSFDTWTVLDTRERQAAAGRRSAAVSKEHHTTAIFDAVSALVAQQESPTQSAVAAKAGVSLSTVKRRWPEVLECLRGVSDGVYPSLDPRGPLLVASEADVDAATEQWVRA
jgi:hypothetical protein